MTQPFVIMPLELRQGGVEENYKVEQLKQNKDGGDKSLHKERSIQV
jgi:hypothetical protein